MSEIDDPYVPMMTYPRKSQKEFLDKLNEETKVPTAVRVREAIDLLREKREQQREPSKNPE